MGLVYATIKLTNVEDLTLHKRGYITKEEIRSIDVKAMADSGAYMLAINEEIMNQLGLEPVEKYPAILADGSVMQFDLVTPVEIRFSNRRATVDALVLPGDAEPLLGAIPMEAMDVVIHPLKQELTVNPKHPLKPQFSMKSIETTQTFH